MITASAPVRICDNGGWTDTWFGGPGRVLNIAVTPGVEVSITVAAGPDPVVLDVGTGDRYAIVPGASRIARHALLEAAIDTLPPPPGPPVEVCVRAAVPAGSGTGTSAAVAVAMLGGLAALRGERFSRRQFAYAAHRLEVDVLGLESGIQDQLCAAFGGINYLLIDHYPDADVQALPPWDELGPLLTLVFLGHAHDSSAVHRKVIQDAGGPGSEAFSRLRAAAEAARHAVVARDLLAFGQALTDNTEAQGRLHPDLVGSDSKRIIEVAAGVGAIGWKVNGAGGDGGSITVLSGSEADKAALERCISELHASYQVLPVRISHAGLTVNGGLQDP